MNLRSTHKVVSLSFCFECCYSGGSLLRVIVMHNEISTNNIKLASTDKAIPRVAAKAFKAAYNRALTSKVGVIVVNNGSFEHRSIEDGKIVTKNLGDAPAPLIVGAGTRKKRR